MDGDGYRAGSWSFEAEPYDDHTVARILWSGPASYYPGRASMKRKLTSELRQRIAELYGHHSDISSNNIQLQVKFSDDAQNIWSPVVIDCVPSIAEYGDERPSVAWYSGGAVPTMACGEWPSSALIPAPLAFASYALDGHKPLTAEDHAGFAQRPPFSPALERSPDLPIAARTAEPRPIDSGPGQDRDVSVDGWHAEPYRLTALHRVLGGRTALDGPVPTQARVTSVLVAVSGTLQDSLREGLLHFVDGIRTILCRALLLVLSQLTHLPAMPSFTLILVAVARRYGRRGEPGDHLFPALRRMSVIIGEAAVRAV